LNPAQPRRLDGLRLIALFKFAKALLLLGMTWGLMRLLDPELVADLREWTGSLTDSFARRLMLQALGWIDHMLDGHGTAVFVVTLVYVAVLFTEGIGLWLRRTWAEWLTVSVTAALIPLELWRLLFGAHHQHLALLVVMAANIAIVVYLVLMLRRSRRARGRA
jgi:uncharacterized membrane protein (DUF2068 family)